MTFGAYVVCILLAYFVGSWTGRGLARLKLRNAIQYQLDNAPTENTALRNVLTNLLSRTKDA